VCPVAAGAVFRVEEMEEPLVSVIIPTYNRAEFVGEAVQSVLCQTYKKLEIIVVDDGSTDDTSKVLKEYRGRIRYIYQERGERSRARNRGFRRSSGCYVAFLDSDDLWLPEKIEKQLDVFEKKRDVGLVYTSVQFIDYYGNPYNGAICWDALARKRRSLYEDLMTDNVISGSTSAVMVRRECLKKVGLFDESMNACEDLDLWRRVAEHYTFHKITAPLVKLRIHPNNTQGRLSIMAEGYEIILNKISQHTPAQFEYYKNQAIIKLLSKIAGLYRDGGQMHSFLFFCGKCVLRRQKWITDYNFWRDFVRLAKQKYPRLPKQQ
jgi:glycosyltransferase involved in cell wall biosynthesis